MSGDLNPSQKIRLAAVHCAVNLEHGMPEVETVDRVLRNAQLIAAYMTGRDADADADTAGRVWPFPVQDESGQP